MTETESLIEVYREAHPTHPLNYAINFATNTLNLTKMRDSFPESSVFEVAFHKGQLHIIPATFMVREKCEHEVCQVDKSLCEEPYRKCKKDKLNDDKGYIERTATTEEVTEGFEIMRKTHCPIDWREGITLASGAILFMKEERPQ